jgi:psp operon transcriptional activator
MTFSWTDARGTSDVYLDFQARLALLAACDRPVLVIGERGTGKELAVQRLHYLSPRWDRNLVTVLGSALHSGLAESELFGHEAGAFTGARGRHAGYFERADKGTIFLDEVADLPLPLQDKLLRVLEYGTFERVGGTAPLRVDARVMAATNRDLPDLARKGEFRADLLDRLSFDVLHVPPLRARAGDRLLLARYFASRMAAELGLPANSPAAGEQALAPDFAPVFGEKALRQLEEHPWPGNVRELKNVVERAVLRRRSLEIESLDLDPFVLPPSFAPALPEETPRERKKNVPPGPEGSPPEQHPVAGPEELPPGYNLPRALAEQERRALLLALSAARFRQTTAASLLGLTYHQFRALYRKHREWLNGKMRQTPAEP